MRRLLVALLLLVSATAQAADPSWRGRSGCHEDGITAISAGHRGPVQGLGPSVPRGLHRGPQQAARRLGATGRCRCGSVLLCAAVIGLDVRFDRYCKGMAPGVTTAPSRSAQFTDPGTWRASWSSRTGPRRQGMTSLPSSLTSGCGRTSLCSSSTRYQRARRSRR